MTTEDLSLGDDFVAIDEARIVLRLSHNIVDRLVKASMFHKFPTMEAYCVARLIESLNQKVGAAYIDSPTSVSGVEAQKITGPIGGIVSRG